VDWLEAGGNLLWLLDPGPATDNLMGLAPLATYLGIRALPGVVVDARAGELGFDAPTYAVIEDWPDQALGRDLKRPAVLPGSLGFAVTAAPGWRMDATLSCGRQCWNETGPIRGEITLDPAAGEEPGPLPLAVVLARPRPSGDAAAPVPDATTAGPAGDAARAKQRVIVVGDGDFASNAHLASAENRTLALRMVRWLTGLEDLIAPPPGIDDRDNFSLSATRTWAISAGTVFVVPGLLLGAGLWLRWRRERV
jgi:hypothetical protein